MNLPRYDDDVLDMLEASTVFDDKPENFSFPHKYSINLQGYDLSEANLNGANFANTNMRNVNFRNSYLDEDISFEGADLTRAFLEDALIPEDLEQQVFSLRGAIMPDGTMFPVNAELIKEAQSIVSNSISDGGGVSDLVAVNRYDIDGSKLAALLIIELIDSTNRNTPVNDALKLLRRMKDRFNERELNDLCFRLNVGYEDLKGNNQLEKIRELIKYMTQRCRLSDLIMLCTELHPGLDWDVVIKDRGKTTLPKLDVAIVIDVARPILQNVASYLDDKNIDANFVVFRHEQVGQFFSIEDDWQQISNVFGIVMDRVKREFDGAQIHFFLAGPGALLFNVGCIWGTIDDAKVYHYQNNTYHLVISLQQMLSAGN